MAQKSIKSFFQPQKRKCLDELTNSVNKTETNVMESKSGPSKEKIFKQTPLTVNKCDSDFSKAIQAQIKQTPILPSTIGHSWFRVLGSEFKKPYFIKLSQFIESERKNGTIYPPREEVFSWTELCRIEDVKVIILGQDPYHGPGQAHGISFSVKKGVRIPPSLLNMYKEIKSSYPEFDIPKHGFLSSWAQQGVLMLNACLTVRAGQANSHADKGWEKLTDAVIEYFGKNRENCVFLLWGSYAQKKEILIDKKKHRILKTTHPSPLSASRGFMGCGHFKLANDYLKESGLETIDWTKLE